MLYGDCLLLLRELVEFVCSADLSETQVAYMKILIEEYVETQKTLFPHHRLRPKHHYLLHYPDLTLTFGPLIRIWTMRFESKHSYFKRCIRSSKNFKNVTKSLADRHQLLQTCLSSSGMFNSEVKIFDFTKYYPELYDGKIKDAHEDFYLDSSSSVVTDDLNVRSNRQKSSSVQL